MLGLKLNHISKRGHWSVVSWLDCFSGYFRELWLNYEVSLTGDILPNAIITPQHVCTQFCVKRGFPNPDWILCLISLLRVLLLIAAHGYMGTFGIFVFLTYKWINLSYRIFSVNKRWCYVSNAFFLDKKNWRDKNHAWLDNLFVWSTSIHLLSPYLDQAC